MSISKCNEVNDSTTSEWISLRVYVGNGDSTDDFLPIIGSWLAELSILVPINRWYFLRYIDNNGHHIRFRICSDADSIDYLYTKIYQLESAAFKVDSRVHPRIVSDPLTSIQAGRRGVNLDLYSPELLKYGGELGVNSAEQHFHNSSVWCFENKIWTISDQKESIAMAARYLSLLLSRLQDGDSHSILRNHTTRWAKRLPYELRVDSQKLNNLIREIVDYETKKLDFCDLSNSLLKSSGFLSAKDDYNNWSQRTIDLIHMDMNRFGLNIPEECIAGIAARYININN